MAEDFVLEVEHFLAEQRHILLEHLVLGREFAGAAFEAIDVLLLALSALVCSDAVLLEVVLPGRRHLERIAVSRVGLDHLRLRLGPTPLALGGLWVGVDVFLVGWYSSTWQSGSSVVVIGKCLSAGASSLRGGLLWRGHLQRRGCLLGPQSRLVAELLNRNRVFALMAQGVRGRALLGRSDLAISLQRSMREERGRDGEGLRRHGGGVAEGSGPFVLLGIHGCRMQSTEGIAGPVELRLLLDLRHGGQSGQAGRQCWC